MEPCTLGVEEELFLVDPETLALVPKANAVLARLDRTGGPEAEHELLRAQVEVATTVCHDLEEVRAQLEVLRSGVAAAAAAEGCRVAVMAAHPFAADDEPITGKPRYEMLAATYQAVARDFALCGRHVHVGVPDRDAGILALAGVRPWLPVLLALTAGSPHRRGIDTGYASARTLGWAAWPTSGPPPDVATWDEHEALVESLLATGVVGDRGSLYWDARLSHRYPTLELRIGDIALDLDAGIAHVAVCRALVATALDGRPSPHVTNELLRVATWRAARAGLTGDLVDPRTGRPAAAEAVVEALLDHVRPALERADALADVEPVVQRLLETGGIAGEHRRIAVAGRLEDVVRASLLS